MTSGGGGGGASAGGGAAGGGGGGGGGGNGTGGGGSSAGDLPCDVAAVLSTNCQSCHGTTLTGGALMALVTRADLTASSVLYPGTTVASRCVTRMQQSVAPMPPAPAAAATSADITTMQNWIAAGMPAGACGNPDAGQTGPQPTTCASNNFYVPNGDGSRRMDPGQACVACHNVQSQENAYFFMGTVFPAYHEKDNCFAPPVSGGTVEILDSSGTVVYTLTPNSAGNFYQPAYSAGLSLPYTARVTANGKTLSMTTPQTSGDCNACHTEQGLNGAPGRIVWP